METNEETVVDNSNRYYDNEWVRFVNQLSKNEALGKIAHFAAHSKFTSAAKRKIIIYAYALLGRNLQTTLILGEHDRRRLDCDKAVIDCGLKLGLTNIDITPEFIQICDMISEQFTLGILSATGGFTRRQINTTERTINREERYPQLQHSEDNTIKRLLGFGNKNQEQY